MNDTITVIGNIATPPSVRTTPAGVPVTSFRLASSTRRYDNSTSTWVDGSTNWFTVSTYRKLSEHVAESLHKGDRVIVTGRLRVREWESGDKRGTAVEIDADGIGPDLLWGTTAFTRSSGSHAQNESDSAEVRDEPPADDAWATAQLGGQLSGLAEEGGDERARDRALVGSGIDTPF